MSHLCRALILWGWGGGECHFAPWCQTHPLTLLQVFGPQNPCPNSREAESRLVGASPTRPLLRTWDVT